MAKWLGRFACFAVLSIQWIPFLGIGFLPIMAAMNYAIAGRSSQPGEANRHKRPNGSWLYRSRRVQDDAIAFRE